MKALLESHIADSCLKHFGLTSVKARLYKKNFSDYSLDLPLHLAKKGIGKSMDIARVFVADLQNLEGVKKVEIQAPGFVNIFIKKTDFYQFIKHSICHLSLIPNYVKSIESHWDHIFYAYLRLKMVLNHLPYDRDMKSEIYKIPQEKKIYDCLDELLSDLNLSDEGAAFKNLHYLADAIHGYFNTITLLCDNQVRYASQMQVFLLAFQLFEKTFQWFG